VQIPANARQNFYRPRSRRKIDRVRAMVLVVAAGCGRIGFDVAGADAGSGGPRHVASTLINPAGDLRLCRIAIDGGGNLFAVGESRSVVDVGGGALPFAGLTDVVVASYRPDLGHRWSFAFGGPSTDSCAAIDSAGDRLVVQAQAEGDVDVSGQLVTGFGADDSLVAELEPATGAPLWARAYGGPTDDDFGRGLDVEAAAGGPVHVTMACNGTVDFGGGPVAGFGGRDACRLRLDATGAVTFVDRRGGPDFDAVNRCTS